MLNAEFYALDFIHNHLASPIMDRIMVFLTTLGNGGAIWIILTLLLLCSKKYRKTGVMLAVGLVLGLVSGSAVLKPLIARLRPFQIKEGIELLIRAPRDFSFPSGHTLSSVICAVILLVEYKEAGYYAAVLAFLIAFSRLYLYVHFPTDVFGGIVLGIILGYVSIKLVNFLFQKNSRHINSKSSS